MGSYFLVRFFRKGDLVPLRRWWNGTRSPRNAVNCRPRTRWITLRPFKGYEIMNMLGSLCVLERMTVRPQALLKASSLNGYLTIPSCQQSTTVAASLRINKIPPIKILLLRLIPPMPLWLVYQLSPSLSSPLSVSKEDGCVEVFASRRSGDPSGDLLRKSPVPARLPQL